MKEINKILFIDTETTGLKPKEHDLLSIGYLLYDVLKNEILDEGEIYLKKNKYNVDYNALAVNKFDFSLIKEYGMDILEVRDKILGLIEKSDCIAGYCVNFDIEFLKKKLDWEFYKPVLDMYSVVIYNKQRSFKLTEICQYEGILFENSHCALNDVKATFELFKIYRK